METLSQHYACSYFDLVLSTLVLDHVKDLERVFAEVLDVLKPGGTFLFSGSHPHRAFEDYGQSYFELEPYDQVSPNVGVIIPAYRRPLEDYIRPLLMLGFLLLDLVETRPTEQCKSVRPGSYERMLKRPTMMVTKWRKPE